MRAEAALAIIIIIICGLIFGWSPTLEVVVGIFGVALIIFGFVLSATLGLMVMVMLAIAYGFIQLLDLIF